MGIRGNVYDVTAGGSFYGPGGMRYSKVCMQSNNFL